MKIGSARHRTFLFSPSNSTNFNRTQSTRHLIANTFSYYHSSSLLNLLMFSLCQLLERKCGWGSTTSAPTLTVSTECVHHPYRTSTLKTTTATVATTPRHTKMTFAWFGLLVRFNSTVSPRSTIKTILITVLSTKVQTRFYDITSWLIWFCSITTFKERIIVLSLDLGVEMMRTRSTPVCPQGHYTLSPF